MNEFFEDIWRGLNASPKYMESKYFYDEAGDAIFQEIMNVPEYYLTKSEMDIFSSQSGKLADIIANQFAAFDVIELGPGDCTKSIHLLKELASRKTDFTYYPIDISTNIINQLDRTLPSIVPGMKVAGLNGDYFDMLDELKDMSTRNKVVLFLGSSIGNIPLENTVDFFKALKSHLSPGDLILTGFDLKKDPNVILAAYNDKAGVTKRFNLNLLTRINNTLDADFDTAQFAHAPTYSEETGACESYLVSMKKQRVRVGEVGWIHFDEGERIYMEVSQKYTTKQVDDIAVAAGFEPVHHFYDSKEWFMDALWKCA
ncbi:MAG: dimethylhistidine N-methyltransferase [Flavipsychrobacter sp.]|nr:dimethylhistidine N-methyltransferase [Flavipsychrobacter sp.]